MGMAVGDQVWLKNKSSPQLTVVSSPGSDGHVRTLWFDYELQLREAYFPAAALTDTCPHEHDIEEDIDYGIPPHELDEN